MNGANNAAPGTTPGVQNFDWCMICNRRLKSAESRARGMGSKCYRKHQGMALRSLLAAPAAASVSIPISEQAP